MVRPEHEEALLIALKERSFKHGDFRLASGARSSYYLDVRACSVSWVAYLIGETIYQRTKHLKIDALGGLAQGAIPLVTAAVLAYHRHTTLMEGFWVRDRVKEHGTGRLIEGCLKPGGQVVILEDVTTSGDSCLKAIEAVRALGSHVAAVLTLVDRQASAQRAMLTAGVADFQSVFTLADFGVEARDGSA